ncbi:MAG: ComEA family DNA-binding protein [Candidatus Methylomirabilales bacterium]
MMPRYSRLEVLAVLLLASALALYIWSPLLTSKPATRDWRPETRDRKTLESQVQPPTPNPQPRGPGGWGKPRLTEPVDLNEASRLELEKLPGIGPTLADRIVQHRERYGPFQELEDLMQVEGIGEKRYERLRPWISIVDRRSKEGRR